MSAARNGAVAGGTGIGFTGVLLVAFIVLKLCGVIAWPWWVVLAPAWISLAVLVFVLIGFAAVWVVLGFAEVAAKERRRAGNVRPTEHGPARRWGRRP